MPTGSSASPARRACRTASSRRCSKVISATASTSATTRCRPSSDKKGAWTARRVAELGEEGGLNRDEVETLLSSEAGLKEVAAADRMARNAGIQGVPSFALQGHVLFSGAVPAEEMVQAFRHAWDILKNRAA